MYKTTSLYLLLYVTLFFSLAADSNIMNNYIFPDLVENLTLYLSLVVLMIVVNVRNINNYKIHDVDILIGLFFILFIMLTLKNTIMSGSIRQMSVIFYPVFFFIGRMLYISRKITLHNIIMIMFAAVFINLFASILVMAGKVFMLPENLIVGSTIAGPSFAGSFATRATGFYYSPLTFSGFMIIPLFIGMYYYIYGKGWIKFIVVAPIIGIILSLSRGTVLSIFLGVVFLLLYDILNNKKIINYKKYSKLFILSGGFAILISQHFSISRFVASNTINISVGTRLERFLDDSTIFFSSLSGVLIGNYSNMLGGDSDFLVMLFSVGVPVTFLLCFIIFKLVYEVIKLEAITYFIAAAIVAKGIESLVAGSSWGPPSSFYIFLILGYLYSYKKQYNGNVLIMPDDLGYNRLHS